VHWAERLDGLSTERLTAAHPEDKVQGWVGSLEFDGTFSTKRLYRALQKSQFVKDFYFV